jgi:hypothetical protein
VFRIENEASLAELRDYRHTPDAILLDAFHDTALGGAGITFDWSLAVDAKRIVGDIPLILAGGLTPDNVSDAVRAVRRMPWTFRAAWRRSRGARTTANCAASSRRCARRTGSSFRL